MRLDLYFNSFTNSALKMISEYYDWPVVPRWRTSSFAPIDTTILRNIRDIIYDTLQYEYDKDI